jgi:hypothetical protein
MIVARHEVPGIGKKTIRPGGTAEAVLVKPFGGVCAFYNKDQASLPPSPRRGCRQSERDHRSGDLKPACIPASSVSKPKMKFYRLVVGLLTVWRITHLLQAEDGPWDILVRLRRAAGNSFWGKLLDCFYCLSLWVAAPLAFLLGQTWLERAWLWPALSAGASLLEQASNLSLRIPPAPFAEDPEENQSGSKFGPTKRFD